MAVRNGIVTVATLFAFCWTIGVSGQVMAQTSSEASSPADATVESLLLFSPASETAPGATEDNTTGSLLVPDASSATEPGPAAQPPTPTPVTAPSLSTTKGDLLPVPTVQGQASSEPSQGLIPSASAAQDLPTTETAFRASPPLPETSYQAPTIALGTIMPEFTLPDVIGGERKVPTDCTSELVVLIFFRGAWDPYAQEQLKNFAQRYGQVKDLGAEIVAISGDSVSSLASLRRRELFPFPILADPKFQIGRGFGTLRPEMKETYPACFVLDRQGKILFFRKSDLGPSSTKIDQLLDILRNVGQQVGVKPRSE